MRPLAVGIALSPTWLRGASWREEGSRAEELFALSAYADLARSAEAAHLDFLFAPDASFLDARLLDSAPGFSTLDAHTLVAALAALTDRIGLVPTVQTAFVAPYTAARQVMSLHRLSAGRAGWNVVTALGGAENFGVDTQASSAEKYARAAEFVELVRALWCSYPADAVMLDRASGRFAAAERVRPVDWSTGRFSVAGPLTVAAHASGEPPLFQAGGSPGGVAFAGTVADAVFGCAPDIEDAGRQRAALRAAAEEAGREPDAVRFLPGFSFVLAQTRTEAERLAERARTGGGPPHWTVVGTPDDAVAEVERWSAAGAIDGLIGLAGGSWESIRLFLDAVVPALVERGLFRGPYRAATLRGHLGMAEG